jgi:hypothetical protein
VVFDCISNLEKLRREKANAEARVHAIGWSGLFNAFKGKDDAPMEFIDLLPFVDDIKSDRKRISLATEKVIKKLVKEESLPTQILSILGMLLE